MKFDKSMIEPIPPSELRPGGPTHRMRGATAKTWVPPAATISTPVEVKREPNQTELEAATIINGYWVYEYCPLSVLNGTHSYTPDWTRMNDAGWVDAMMEVKGEHIHSRDSRILFDAARKEYPNRTWIWARKRTKGKKGPRWEIEVYG
jgi:hypothetical protein